MKFGMCFNSDGSLDLEKLKARLGDQVAISNEGYGTSGIGPLEMCNFQTISLSFVVYRLKIKFCEDSLALFR